MECFKKAEYLSIQIILNILIIIPKVTPTKVRRAQVLLLQRILHTTGAPPLTRFYYNTAFYLTRVFFKAQFSHLELNQSSFNTVFPIAR